MKIQCELCREIVGIGAFQIVAGGIEVSCSACQSEFFVSSDGAVSEPRPPRLRSGLVTIRCPKCLLVQPPNTSCRGCGLRVDRFAGYCDEHSGKLPERLAAMFAACQDDWGDAVRHEALVEAVSAERAFSHAARFYREELSRRGDDAIARRQLSRLAKMAEVTFMTQAAARTASDRGPEPYKNVMVMLIVLLVIGAAGLGLYSLVSPGSAQAASMVL